MWPSLLIFANKPARKSKRRAVIRPAHTLRGPKDAELAVFIFALVARLAAVRDVEARPLENDAGCADNPVDCAITFRTGRQGRVVERLHTLKADAAVLTLIIVKWHINTSGTLTLIA